MRHQPDIHCIGDQKCHLVRQRVINLRHLTRKKIYKKAALVQYSQNQQPGVVEQAAAGEAVSGLPHGRVPNKVASCTRERGAATQRHTATQLHRTTELHIGPQCCHSISRSPISATKSRNVSQPQREPHGKPHFTQNIHEIWNLEL